MTDEPLNILLADDDRGDCMLFKEALESVPVFTNLAIVYDGVELMQKLTGGKEPLPDVLFLDLNMPRKNGEECLAEIKRNEKLKYLPVIICSTSYLERIADELYKNGACYYIQKPIDFELFIKLIHHGLLPIEENLPAVRAGKFIQPPKEDFLLNLLVEHLH